MKALALLLSTLFLAFAAPVQAQSHQHQHAASVPASLAEGMVKKIDKPAGKITIAHGPIESINMPPMTMSFAVQNSKMLDTVKAGDKVRFAVESIKDVLTVTRLEVAK